MSGAFKIACVQNCAVAEVERNIAIAARLTLAAIDRGAAIVALPEYFSGVALRDGLLHPAAFEEARHPVLQAFADLARERRAWLLLGSLGVLAGDGRIFNRGYFLDPQGAVAARYDKIHMFDVDLPGGESYRESAVFKPGEGTALAPLPWGMLGLTICYDLRFPHLYRALAQGGADFLTVPSAFTVPTGKAHWHVLLRARAIENGCFVFAPAQCGEHAEGRRTYGHSLIVAPWGEVLAEAGEEPGFILAEIDPAKIAEARRAVPSLGHDRPFASPRKRPAAAE